MLRRRKADQRPGRIVYKVAHQIGKPLPKPDQLATLTRRATDKLFLRRTTKRRAADRRQLRGRLYRIGGLAGVGLLAGGALAARGGTRAWQAATAQLAKVGQPLTRVRQRMIPTLRRTDAGTGERSGAPAPSPSPTPESSSLASGKATDADKDKAKDQAEQPAKAKATTNADR